MRQQQNKQKRDVTIKLLLGVFVCLITWVLVKWMSNDERLSLTHIEGSRLEDQQGMGGVRVKGQVALNKKLDVSYFRQQKGWEEFIERLKQWQNTLPLEISEPNIQTQLSNLGYNFYLNTEYGKFQAAEYLYYQSRYNISEVQQSSMCLILPGRNHPKPMFEALLKSVQQQNYTNYQLIIIDDHSSNYSIWDLQQYIEGQYPGLRGRTVIVAQNSKMGELGNRFIGMSKYCKGDIVVDLSINGELVGRQVLKVINSHYRDESVWGIYSNHIILNHEKNRPEAGYSESILPHLLEKGKYRTAEMYWVTGPLRTFKKSILAQVPPTRYQSPSGEYFSDAGERFLFYDIVELAGNHLKYIPDCLYLHKEPTVDECTRAEQNYHEYQARALPGWERLGSASGSASLSVRQSGRLEMGVGVKQKELEMLEVCV